MTKQKKIIITAAVTGATHTPMWSPYFPATPEQIREDAGKAQQAGPQWFMFMRGTLKTVVRLRI